MSYGNKPFGLDNVKITDLGGVTQAGFSSEQKLSFKPVTVSDKLRGKNRVQAVVTIVDHYEFEIEAGGMDLDVYALLTGKAVVTAGTTPNETTTQTISGGDRLPYFKLYGQSLGEGDDDVHVKLFKCKLEEMPEGEFADGKFFVSKAKGVAIDDGTNGIIDTVQNETSTDLPAT